MVGEGLSIAGTQLCTLVDVVGPTIQGSSKLMINRRCEPDISAMSGGKSTFLAASIRLGTSTSPHAVITMLCNETSLYSLPGLQLKIKKRGANPSPSSSMHVLPNNVHLHKPIHPALHVRQAKTATSCRCRISTPITDHRV